MQKRVLFTIIVFCSVIQSVFSQNVLDFRNKYFLYTNEIKTEKNFFADFFYVSKNDTIIKVKSSFGYRHPVFVNKIMKNGERNITEEMLPIDSERPYVVKIKENIVYYNYLIKDTALLKSNKEQLVTVEQYRLIDGDTCLAKSINKHYNSLVISDVTIYSGIDTTIAYYNYSIECYKFIEYNFRPTTTYKIWYETYIDKKTFIPIKINEYILTNDGHISKQSFILRFTLNLHEVVSNEYFLHQ